MQDSGVMASLEERVVSFTADQIGMTPEEIRLDSRLLHDLGMDGDDAVEFFEKFSERFHVDVTALGNRWSQHFGSEGGVNPVLLAFIGLAFGLAALLHEAVQSVPIWAWCVPLVALVPWTLRRLGVGVDPRILPITVQELVDAAKRGRWSE